MKKEFLQRRLERVQRRRRQRTWIGIVALLAASTAPTLLWLFGE
ncbi:hypothetical protein [uncultured Oxalicibacterium sp.]|nr:hypothetical protein [uncultured Oxalicibacterium sp.]